MVDHQEQPARDDHPLEAPSEGAPSVPLRSTLAAVQRWSLSDTWAWLVIKWKVRLKDSRLVFRLCGYSPTVYLGAQATHRTRSDDQPTASDESNRSPNDEPFLGASPTEARLADVKAGSTICIQINLSTKPNGHNGII